MHNKSVYIYPPAASIHGCRAIKEMAPFFLFRLFVHSLNREQIYVTDALYIHIYTRTLHTFAQRVATVSLLLLLRESVCNSFFPFIFIFIFYVLYYIGTLPSKHCIFISGSCASAEYIVYSRIVA